MSASMSFIWVCADPLSIIFLWAFTDPVDIEKFGAAHQIHMYVLWALLYPLEGYVIWNCEVISTYFTL